MIVIRPIDARTASRRARMNEAKVLLAEAFLDQQCTKFEKAISRALLVLLDAVETDNSQPSSDRVIRRMRTM